MRTESSKEISAELVGSIYEAAVEPAQWRSVLERMTEHFDSGLGILWTHDFADDSVNVASPDPWCIVGVDEDAAASFVGYYSKRSVWAPRARHLPEGQTVVSSALYPEHLLPRTEFYNDWLRPLDLQFGIGSSVVKQDTMDVKLSFVRSGRCGPFLPADQQRLQAVLPHIRSSLRLHRKLRQTQLLADGACAALDRLSFGIILVDREGRVIHANSAAKELATRSGAFSFEAGSLRSAFPADHGKLAVLLKGAAQTGAGVGKAPGGALKLRGKRGSAHVTVAPMPASQTPASFGTAVAAVVFCSDSAASPRSLALALQALHGLTPAEGKLADALVAGFSLQDYAQAQDLSIHTARSQLKAISQKTGARRQADLVRLLLSSVPPLAGGP